MHTNHEWDEPGTKDTYCIKCGNSFEVLELVADLLEALKAAKSAVAFLACATDSDPEDQELLALVNKAIAKAKGE